MQIIRSFLQRIPSSAVFLMAAALLILAFAWAVPAQAASICFGASDSGRKACERTFAPLQTGRWHQALQLDPAIFVLAAIRRSPSRADRPSGGDGALHASVPAALRPNHPQRRAVHASGEGAAIAAGVRAAPEGRAARGECPRTARLARLTTEADALRCTDQRQLIGEQRRIWRDSCCALGDILCPRSKSTDQRLP